MSPPPPRRPLVLACLAAAPATGPSTAKPPVDPPATDEIVSLGQRRDSLPRPAGPQVVAPAAAAGRRRRPTASPVH